MPADALLQSLSNLWTDPTLRRVLWFGLTWLGIVILSRTTSVFFNRIDDRLTAYGVPERRLAKLDFLAHMALVLVGVFVTLWVLGITQALWGAVAVTSVAGVLIALAAQRLAQNLLAGIVILFERPFIVGDTVDIGGQLGTVTKVTLHSTMLASPDGLRVLLPNAKVLDSTLTNFSANTDRRVVLTIDVAESVDLERVRRILREAVESEEHIASGRDVVVFAKQSLDEGVRFEVRYWVDARRYGEHCLPTAMGRVLDALNAEGLATAIPTQRVHVAGDVRAGG